jgi:hypothetical protein
MRTTIIFSALLLSGIAASAQEETLFSRSGGAAGGFGGPIWEFTNVRNQFTVNFGGGGGVIVDGFFLGGFGLGGALPRTTVNERRVTPGFGYGGLWLGYVYPSEKAIHFYSSVKVGWGAVAINFEDFNLSGDASSFFALTPEAGVELNLFRWFRLVAAAGYRWVNGYEPIAGITQSELRGVTGSLTLRFGGFGHKRE